MNEKGLPTLKICEQKLNYLNLVRTPVIQLIKNPIKFDWVFSFPNHNPLTHHNSLIHILSHHTFHLSTKPIPNP